MLLRDIIEAVRDDPSIRQSWGDATGYNKQERESSTQDIYKKAKVLADKHSNTLKRGLMNATKKIKDRKILIDTKSLISFMEKTLSRNRPTSTVTDVLRAAVLVSTEEEVEKVAKIINKQFNVLDHDYKTLGNTSGGYYGAHHYLVSLGEEDSLIVEIQLMTKRLWVYKNEAHKIYDRYKSATNIDPEAKRFDDVRSKDIFRAGNAPKIKRRIDRRDY